MMSDKVNPVPHIDQNLEHVSFPYHLPQIDDRPLTDDEKIALAAARILETYRETFLELAK